MPPPPLSPRPAPPNEQTSSRTLHPIYQALDSHNYSKALKLTAPSSSSSSGDWDIVRALRVHALERSGKRREALLLLWEVLAHNVAFSGEEHDDDDDDDEGKKKKNKPKAGEAWRELHERIASLTDAADLVDDAAAAASANKNNNNRSGPPDVRPMDAVHRLDVEAYAPIALPEKGEPSSSAPSASPGGGSGSSSSSNNKASSANKPSSKPKKGGKNKKNGSSSSSAPTAVASSSSSASLPPVTDETVLQTICVTLRAEGLYDTMSEMYFRAVETLSGKSDEAGGRSTRRRHVAEECKSVLEEAACVHFKAVFDCSDVVVTVGNNVGKSTGDGKETDDGGDGGTASTALRGQLPKLRTLLRVAKYYDRMQTSSLQLAKLSSQPLHFQWTAISSLWYKESLQELVATLETIRSLLTDAEKDGAMADASAMQHLRIYLLQLMQCSNLEDIDGYLQKTKQKMALLPRLAESLSSRMVLTVQRTVSENDWDVYLETLLVQHKKEEALEVLKNIRCTPMTAASEDDGGGSSGTTDDVLPQIDDEDTIENHAGSMLPYTQRKKLERLARLSQELGLWKEAEGYYRELLHAFPDQWTYWLGLVDACVWMESSTSSSGEVQKINAKMDEEGWERCQSFSNEVISAIDGSGKHALRGPHLISLELASIKVRQAGTTDIINGGEKDEHVTLLRDKICAYGNQFGPSASCCFADIRSYLSILVQASLSGEVAALSDISNDVSHLLKWAQEMWTKNSQSNAANGGSEGGEVSQDEFRERRKKLRSYIFAVQVVYGIAVELGSLSLAVLQSYASSTSLMVTEWRTSLAFLPGVAPKDGGQKEVLPGDEIVLLTSQYLQFEASKQSSKESNAATNPHLVRAAGLLEEAIDHSPYNPHLKIAAIGVYSELNAAHRALSIYEGLGIKQIQLDSCSYLISSTLIKGGLYTSAIKLSASILRLHGSTSKEVKDYASRSLRNGLMFKAKEMATFQREKMRPSLQLLHSKGLLMDAAPLLIPSDLVSNDMAGATKQKGKLPPVKLGMEKGYCGSDDDLERAEQLSIDAEVHFNAPAIIHHASQCTDTDDIASSDNRDLTINYFEILYKNAHLTKHEMVVQSLRRGHMHGLLTRAVMAMGAANAPKKGKIPKPTDETMHRCQSLQQSLLRAKDFREGLDMDEIDRTLWDACCNLCQSITIVIQGVNGNSTANDTLAEREAAAVSIIDSTMQLVQRAQKSFLADQSNGCSSSMGARSCQLLPDHVVPCYVLLETVGRLFTLFGWGKRKRLTKAASGALANLALALRNLITDMLQAMSKFRSSEGDGDDTVLKSVVGSAVDIEVGTESIQRVLKEIVSSREMTTDRVDPFLIQMKESLETFDEQ